jgi:glycerophosphoryl diester phosphodiesterase
MASFRAAVELGCDWVECDCRPSHDGVIVLSHDAAVTDTGGRVLTVSEHSAQELARLDLGNGEGVPSLSELVSWATGRCGVMADVKCEGFEAEIGLALAPLPVSDVLAPGASALSRARFRYLFPRLPLSLSVGPGGEQALTEGLPGIDTGAVTLHHSLVTAERVVLLHDRGIRVFAWTVDDLPALRRLAGMGVDGLISNRADLLASL